MEPVQVFADWDADGIVSAALIHYAQKFRGKYPIPGEKADVGFWPGGPRSTLRNIEELIDRAHRTRSYPRVAVFLDIPLTEPLYEKLKKLLREIPNLRLIYIDHHYSTLANARKLYELTEEAHLGHRPTAILVYNLLRSLGVRHVTPRLEAFMKAVGVLERDRPASPGEEKVVRLAASLSKATAVTRDPELWRRLVLWLSSPFPAPAPVDEGLVERVVRIAEESDKELMDKARMFAPSMRKIGFMKVLDLRGKGVTKGISALTSKLYRIAKCPVAVIASVGDYDILVVRAPGKIAYRMALLMLRRGLAENIGGHGSIAVVRLKKGIDDATLFNELRRISFEAQRGGGGRGRVSGRLRPGSGPSAAR